MPEILDISIKGDKKLARELDKLPDKYFKRTVRRATAKGNQILKKEIKKHAPTSKKDPNDARRGRKNLRRSLGGKVVQYPKEGVWHGMVAPRRTFKGMNTGRGPGTIVHLLEFGHRIAPRRSGAQLKRINLDRVGRGGRITKRKQIANPVSSLGFVKPSPFMFPGIKAAEPKAVRAAKAELKKGLEDAARDMAAKVNG